MDCTNLGPISHIDWIEEVIPVFGKILITPADVVTKRTSYYPTYFIFILGCAVLFIVTVAIKQIKDAENKKVFTNRVTVLKISQEKFDEEISFDEVFKLSKETNSIKNEEKIQEGTVAVLSENILKEKIEVSFQHETESLSSNKDYSVQLENILPQKNEKFAGIDHSKRQWCYYQEFKLEDVEWIKKIKTFKITKVIGRKKF